MEAVRDVLTSQKVVRLERRLRERQTSNMFCNRTAFIKLASLEAMCSFLFNVYFPQLSVCVLFSLCVFLFYIF